jgi:hypothetical protein
MRLTASRRRLVELLGQVCQRPEVPGSLAGELDRVATVLRNYAFVAERQRDDLVALCQELDEL